MLLTRRRLAAVFASLMLLAGIGTASAAEVTLTAVSFLPPNDGFAKPFVEFVNDVNEKGKGQIRIDLKPPGTVTGPNMGTAVKSGAVDIAYTPSTFYKNLLPAGDAIYYATKTPDQLKQNGGFALWQKLHAERVNAHLLGEWGMNVPFYLYFTESFTPKLDNLSTALNGARIRISPLYRGLVRDMGGNGVQIPPSEIYTALERRMVDGVGYPGWDLESGGWGKFIKRRLDVPFYGTQQATIINLTKWQSLTEEQRKILQTAADAMSTRMWNAAPGISNEERERQKKSGIDMMPLSPAATAEFRKKAYEAGWAEVMALDPINGAQLKALFYAE